MFKRKSHYENKKKTWLTKKRIFTFVTCKPWSIAFQEEESFGDQDILEIIKP